MRELANVLERAQILAEDALITVDDLPDALFLAAPAAAGEDESGHNLRDAQRRHVLAVLREEKGNKAHAARALGISRRALYRLLEKYQLDQPEEKSGDSVSGTSGIDAN